MKKFRTLELAIEYYGRVENIKLPRHLKEQLLRAASSVSLNLSEGNAKRSYANKKRIYQIALGSSWRLSLPTYNFPIAIRFVISC